METTKDHETPPSFDLLVSYSTRSPTSSLALGKSPANREFQKFNTPTLHFQGKTKRPIFEKNTFEICLAQSTASWIQYPSMVTTLVFKMESTMAQSHST